MTVWKRWSWRYRVLALLGLALLLQGAACPNMVDKLPRYGVPGVGLVVGQKLTDAAGDYYWLVQPDGIFWAIRATTPAYAVTDAYFKNHPELPIPGLDRSAIPGGASTPAAPPGM